MGFNGIQDQGLMGIGTLIIFISVILVAAVAAGVLISTGGSLQQKALVTGNQAEEGVATGVEVVTVHGEDSSNSGTPHELTRLTMIMRMGSGSEPINLNNSVIMLDTPTTTQSMSYNETVSEGGLASTTTHYVIIYAKLGPQHEDGYMQRGDVAQILIKPSTNVGENEKIRIHFIPRVGTVTEVQFITPDTMTEKKVFLWPTS